MSETTIADIVAGVSPLLREQVASIVSDVEDIVARLSRDYESRDAVRAAEHRAFLAEAREDHAAMMRKIEARLSEVRDGKDGTDGRDGTDGLPGADGRDGLDGKDGRDGTDGAPGRDGEPGEKGEPGLDGAAGVDGKDGAVGIGGRDGADGLNGTDGRDGIGLAGMMIERDGGLIATMTDGALHKLGPVVGRDGTDGRDGRDGIDGVNGRDGTSITGAEIEDESLVLFLSDDRSIELRGIRGDAGEKGDPGETAYAGQARGLYDEADAYRAMDVVSFNGCEWRARCDAPGVLPGPDWMLSAKQGKPGKPGNPGPTSGGASLLAGYVKGSTLILTDEAGREVEVDLYDFGRAVRDGLD